MSVSFFDFGFIFVILAYFCYALSLTVDLG